MKKIYLLLCLALAVHFSFSQTPTVGFAPVLSGLTSAVDIVNAKDGSNRLFFVQQNGAVRVYQGGALLTTPFINLASVITYADGGERGLLSLVFHPQYAANGYFFVFYNNTAGSIELVRYKVSAANANVADPASGQILLTIPKPFTNHNGAKLNFGPDGNLYISTGDGGDAGDPGNRAQNPNSLLGKMLRINVDNFTTPPFYSIPATNPYVGIAGTRPEIFQLGLRNPWRWNFDRLTGDMWIADVGQGAWEEINFVSAAATNGLNFGWRCYEGTHPYNLSNCGTTPAAGKTFPIFEYPHNSSGGFSVTGGLVYRGTEFPQLQGFYFCADYVRPNGWLIKPAGAGAYTILGQTNFPANVSTFGDAEDGTLYLATLSGTIYKIFQSNVVALNLLAFDARRVHHTDILTWRAALDPELLRFEIERSFDGTRFYEVGRVNANAALSDYDYQTLSVKGTHYFRLKLVTTTGSIRYSEIKTINDEAGNITVSNLSGNMLQLNTSDPLRSVVLFTAAGQAVKTISNLSPGTHTISAEELSAGLYFLRCIRNDGSGTTMRAIIN